MATITSLLTAEEYARLPDPGHPTELIQGQVISRPPPMPRHGELCAQIVYLLRRFLEDHPLGRVLSNDSGVVTERNPDTVRGADIAYYSFQRVPKGPLPDGLLSVAPELVFEVLSPEDRWREVHVKVAEYLHTGVFGGVRRRRLATQRSYFSRRAAVASSQRKRRILVVGNPSRSAIADRAILRVVLWRDR